MPLALIGHRVPMYMHVHVGGQVVTLQVHLSMAMHPCPASS